MKQPRKPSRRSDIPLERPKDQRVGMPVSHCVFSLQVPDDLHVLLETGLGYDLLPCSNRPSVLLLNRREIRRWTFLRPRR